MPQDKFYFVYHDYHGQICVQTWWGDVTVGGQPMATLAKFPITEAEFKLPLDELRSKYPYNG